MGLPAYSSQESGFYYLKSRYYDPAICRFINADGLASTGQGFLGCNMFAYCLNNPVYYKDAYGKYPVPSVDPYEEYINRERAREKYNSSTVNVYFEGEGAEIDGMLNIRFYYADTAKTKVNISIADSLSISNPYEQEAVLDVIIGSPYYSFKMFGSREFMQAQWVAHNLAHDLSSTGEPWITLATWFSGSTNPVESSQTLDIRSTNNIGHKAKLVYLFLEFGDNYIPPLV